MGSLVWNSIVEVFKKEKNMDITSYLISVTIKNHTLVIKTNKPVVNAALYLLSDIIKQSIQEKFKKV